MEYLALFYTTHGSIKFKKKLINIGMEVEVLPVPRRLSSGCGVAVKFFSDQDVSSLIDQTVEKLYRITQSEYQLVYGSE
ncbi:MAG: hypothetical protein APF84_04465 [Gracilibacter sp. BRH_c7a]|nr:MAG: hypothetical protein APF84_04465 [Gracilibacter sp. BRH_c7a]